MSTATTSVQTSAPSVPSAPAALAFPAFPEYDPPVVDWHGREREPVDAPAWLASLSGLCPFVANTDEASERASRAVCYALSADWDGKKSATDVADSLASEPALTYSDLLSRMAVRSARYTAYQRDTLVKEGRLLADYLSALFCYASGHALPAIPCPINPPPTPAQLEKMLEKIGERECAKERVNYTQCRAIGAYVRAYLSHSDSALRHVAVENVAHELRRWRTTDALGTLVGAVQEYLAAEAIISMIGDGRGTATRSDSKSRSKKKENEALPWNILLAFRPLIALDCVENGKKTDQRKLRSNNYTWHPDFADLSFPLLGKTGLIVWQEGADYADVLRPCEAERCAREYKNGATIALTFGERCQRLMISIAKDGNNKEEAITAVNNFLEECTRRRKEIADAILASAARAEAERKAEAERAARAAADAARARAEAETVADTLSAEVETAAEAEREEKKRLAEQAKQEADRKAREENEAKERALKAEQQRKDAEEEKKSAAAVSADAQIAVDKVEEKKEGKSEGKGKGKKKDTTPTPKGAPDSKAPTLADMVQGMEPKQAAETFATLIINGTSDRADMIVHTLLRMLASGMDAKGGDEEYVTYPAVRLALDVIDDEPQGRAALAAAIDAMKK